MNPRLRVAVVSDAVAPYHLGGKETRYSEIVRRLPGHDCDVTLCTMRWWPSDEPPVAVEGVEWRALCRAWPMYVASGRRSTWQAFAFAMSCLRLLRGRYDVIEADHMPGPQLLVLRLVATIRRVPLQATWHEVWGRRYWRSYLGPIGGRVAACIELLAARCPDRIVAASSGTADRLIKVLHVPAARVRVIENGVDVGLVGDADEVVAAPLLYVGRLIDHKRVDVLLRALAFVQADRDCRSGGRVTLDVIGQGPERHDLEVLADELGIGADVTFLGSVGSVDDVWSRMRGARVFVTASEREGFGIAVLEAMASGLPVIVSDHGSNEARHLVRDGLGSCASAGDASDFARKISAQLDQPHEPAEVRERFMHHHPSLTWDNTARSFAEVCRSGLVAS